MPKKTAIQLILNQGLISSKEEATALIMAAKLAAIPLGKEENYKREELIIVSKAGDMYDINTSFCLVNINNYVSRGGEKLITALEYFNYSPKNAICLDAGASTGGFTDCLLQHGAKKVYAIDVGTLQLHEKLRRDDRVISMENTNLRFAPKEIISEEIDVLVGDLSFISLTMILPNCMQWLKKGADIFMLIKPQFEVEPHMTVKGVVKDENYRQYAIDKVLNFCKENLPLEFHGIVPSKIKGPKGNQEYIAYWSKND